MDVDVFRFRRAGACPLNLRTAQSVDEQDYPVDRLAVIVSDDSRDPVLYRGQMLTRNSVNAVVPCGSGLMWRLAALVSFTVMLYLSCLVMSLLG